MASVGYKVVGGNGERTVQIFGKADVADCEEIIGNVLPNGGPTRIQVATDWQLDAKPGGAAAAMQAIISWARSQDGPVLVTHSRPGDPGEVPERFSERVHGMCAVMMSAAVIAADGTTDVRRAAWDSVYRRAAAMDRMKVVSIMRGQSLSLD